MDDQRQAQLWTELTSALVSLIEDASQQFVTEVAGLILHETRHVKVIPVAVGSWRILVVA